MRVSPLPSRQRVAVQPNEQSVSSASEQLQVLPSLLCLSSIQGDRFSQLACSQSIRTAQAAQGTSVLNNRASITVMRDAQGNQY